MRAIGVTLFAAFLFAATASAASTVNIAPAMKALHYPKAGAVKLTCRRAGVGFSCKAVYRRNVTKRFYAAWQATGGYLCAGARPSTCQTLRHGFVVGSYGTTDLPGVAEMVSRGYVALKYNDPQPFGDGNCTPATAPNSWSYCYKLDTGGVNVTIHLARAKGGYITTTSATMY